MNMIQIDNLMRNTPALMAALFLAVFMLVLPAWAVSPPTFSLTTGTYTSSQTLTMTASTGTIYYTTDGTDPSISATRTTIVSGSSITVSTPTQVNATVNSSGLYSSTNTVFLDVDPDLSPIVNSSLVLRLRADFGVLSVGTPGAVRLWTDLSGAGSNASNNTTGTQPLLVTNSINGLPAVSFNGSSQFLSLASGFSNFSSGATIFLVTSPVSFSAHSRFLDLGNGTNSNNIYLSQGTSSGAAEFHVFGGVGSSNDSSIISSTALTIGQYQLLTATYTGSSGTLATNTFQNAQGSLDASVNITRSLNFLGEASGTGNFFNGNICELLVYNTALTASQIGDINAYLLQKYQVLSQNATATPAPPVISVSGGMLPGPSQVVFTAPPGAVVRYTISSSPPGTPPTSSSPAYNGQPIPIYYTQTLNAMSFKNGVSSPMVTCGAYTLDSNQYPAPSTSDMSTPSITIQLPQAD